MWLPTRCGLPVAIAALFPYSRAAIHADTEGSGVLFAQRTAVHQHQTWHGRVWYVCRCACTCCTVMDDTVSAIKPFQLCLACSCVGTTQKLAVTQAERTTRASGSSAAGHITQPSRRKGNAGCLKTRRWRSAFPSTDGVQGFAGAGLGTLSSDSSSAFSSPCTTMASLCASSRLNLSRPAPGTLQRGRA